jgi:hypothetical protein
VRRLAAADERRARVDGALAGLDALRRVRDDRLVELLRDRVGRLLRLATRAEGLGEGLLLRRRGGRLELLDTILGDLPVQRLLVRGLQLAAVRDLLRGQQRHVVAPVVLDAVGDGLRLAALSGTRRGQRGRCASRR